MTAPLPSLQLCVDCGDPARPPSSRFGPAPKRCDSCEEVARRRRHRERSRRYRLTHPQQRSLEQIRAAYERRRADPDRVQRDREYSRRLNREHPELRHHHHLLYRYGIGRPEFEAMLAEQNGLCRLCGGPLPTDRNPSVDHDHATGRVRGLLCATCNFRLGFIETTPPEWWARLHHYIGATDEWAPAIAAVQELVG